MTGEPSGPVPVVVLRLVRSYWHDDSGLHVKTSLRFLKRRCVGHNFLKEDADMGGVSETIARINNLERVPDGVYRLECVNETSDWETGYVDDWDYLLVPLEEQEKK